MYIHINLFKRFYGAICSRVNIMPLYKLKTRDLHLIEVARRSVHDQLHGVYMFATTSFEG